jgi:hypothetical protein
MKEEEDDKKKKKKIQVPRRTQLSKRLQCHSSGMTLRYSRISHVIILAIVYGLLLEFSLV